MASHSDHQRTGQSVGSKLRAARLARKMTQSKLAQPDFSVSYVSAIERDQIQPSLRALEIFAQRLGITSTDLLSKTSGHMKPGLSEKDAAHEHKQEIELKLLEAQLLLLQDDSRKAMEILRNISSDSLKSHQAIQHSYLLGFALYDAGFMQESESVLTEAYSKATLENDYFARRILDMLGLVNVSMHNHAQSFEYQLRNVDQLEKEKHPGDAFFAAQVYANLGVHYQDLNKIDDAIEMFRNALAKTHELVSPELRTMMYWNMSTSLAEAQQYFLCMLYAHKVLHLLVQQYHHTMGSEIYHYLGRSILQQNEQDALLTLEQFMNDALSQNDMLALASLTATAAELLFRQSEQEKAFEYAQRACELASTQKDGVIIASIFLTCGRISYAQGNYQEGDTQFLTGLHMLERLKNYKEYSEKCALYAELLEQRGLPLEALEYYKKAYKSGLEPE